jgi:multidrug efflux system membrane fusion protein
MSPDSSSGNETAVLVTPPATRRRRQWVLPLAVLVIAALVAGIWYAWPRAADAPGPGAGPGSGGGKGGRGDPASRPQPVVAAQARQGSIDVVLDALGTVTPRNIVTVRSRVDGQLINIAFREGQMVKAGDLLAEIDPRTYQVQLTQAQGQMAKDQALLANARVDLQRYQTLLAQDSIAKQQVDTQEALVRQYQGVIDADQGAVDSAKLQLSFTRITAPIAGRVGLRQVDPGNMIHASDANGLVVITQMQPTTVVFPVPEDNLPRVMKRLQSGDTIAVEALDRSQKVQLGTGKLVTADNQIDTTTGTVKLKAEFANENGILFPNQFVNVRMPVERRDNVVLVPSAAVQRGSPGTYVYVVNDDQTVTVTPIKVGAVQGETTEVQNGLRAGAHVVVDGADKLRDGAKVELIDPNARNAAPAAADKRGRGAGGKAARGDVAGEAAPGAASANVPGNATPAAPAAAGDGKRSKGGN